MSNTATIIKVHHLRKLVKLLAAKSPPTFVQEIKDIRTTSEETVTFECIFSGTPTPGKSKVILLFAFSFTLILIVDIVWYHNDKVIRNTDKIKVRIEKNRTTCTVKKVSKENTGVYVCKAVSDAGVTVTKAKLYIQEVPHPKKKELEEKTAEQQEEKVKKERVKLEKTIKKKPQKPSVVTTELEETIEVKETRPIETTEEIPDVIEEDRAKSILPVHTPLQTEAIASCKKIDESEEIVPKDKAEEVISPAEPLYIEESTVDDVTKEFKDKKPKTRQATVDVEETTLQSAVVTEVKLQQVIERVEEIIAKEEIKMAKEITEILETIKVKEFGPGENPLREIAEIGYLLRNGITTKEITVLYHEEKFPSLKTPEAQSALVSVIERKGYGPLVSEVLTEEKTVDEKELAATVGFRAFMKMVDLKHVTVEEVITHFKPDDFIHHAWQTTELKEVQSTLITNN